MNDAGIDADDQIQGVNESGGVGPGVQPIRPVVNEKAGRRLPGLGKRRSRRAGWKLSPMGHGTNPLARECAARGAEQVARPGSRSQQITGAAVALTGGKTHP
jgi:hypothetical protein